MILVELVPKDLTELTVAAKEILNRFPIINGINLPDIINLPIRSHEAAQTLLNNHIPTTPHLRAIDRSINDSLQIIRELMQLGLTDILIINGDNKENLPLENRPNTLELVTACSKTFPKLNIYCGLDPYRASIKNELTYCRQKLAAGAKGFFTQPFFDAHLAQIYLEHLADAPIFLGITPVLSEKSKSYWENRNNAIFPNNFCLDIPCNIQIAKELIALTQKFQQHTYLMPITMTPADYVQAIFN